MKKSPFSPDPLSFLWRICLSCCGGYQNLVLPAQCIQCVLWLQFSSFGYQIQSAPCSPAKPGRILAVDVSTSKMSWNAHDHKCVQSLQALLDWSHAGSYACHHWQLMEGSFMAGSGVSCPTFCKEIGLRGMRLKRSPKQGRWSICGAKIHEEYESKEIGRFIFVQWQSCTCKATLKCFESREMHTEGSRTFTCIFRGLMRSKTIQRIWYARGWKHCGRFGSHDLRPADPV